jgi:protocatechuate 3,4-dioxygenase beta subunit
MSESPRTDSAAAGWPDETAGPEIEEIEDHDRGLLFDIQTLVQRRTVLGLVGGLGVLAGAAACASGGSTTSAASSTTSATSGTSTSGATRTSSGSAAEVPDETAGPYPGDGSNGANVLDDSGIVRSDITSSFGSSTTKAAGIPLTIELTVKDATTGAALTGAAVYAWHCDREGRYSMYSQGVTNENYLRGVQPTDSGGTARFTSIFPACYSGRWPHVHFEVYRSTDEATANGQIVKTSQLALPEDACNEVYATTGYSQSVTNLSRVSLETDNVFRDDGAVRQLATVTGSTSSGYTAKLTVGV